VTRVDGIGNESGDVPVVKLKPDPGRGIEWNGEKWMAYGGLKKSRVREEGRGKRNPGEGRR